MFIEHPDGGHCNTEGMTSDCYGCICYGAGLTERCKERVKQLKGLKARKGELVMSKFNLPCPHSNNKECEYCKGITAQDGWKFKGCFYPPNKGKFVANVKECPLGHRKENEL